MAVKYEQVVYPVDVDIIMREWIKGFKLADPTAELINTEWYYDQAKGKVVFVMSVKKEV